MDTLKAVRRHLVLQQRWVKLCCVAVVLVTLLSLLLGTLGTDKAQLRSTGMGAFTEEDIGKYNLGHHVDNLKQAGSRIVKSLWWWSDDDDEDFTEEESGQEAWEEAEAAEGWSGGEGWNAQDQAELDAYVPEQGQGGGGWQEGQQQEWAPAEAAWSEDAAASKQAWQQEAGSSEERPAEQSADAIGSAAWATRADSAGDAQRPAETGEWAAEATPTEVAEWAAEGAAPDEQWKAEGAEESGGAEAAGEWEDPNTWGEAEVWEEAQASLGEHRAGAAAGTEWSESQSADTWEAEPSAWQPEPGTKTADEDAWREEEQWAEESQPSGPYEEEPVIADSDGWEAMSKEEASEIKSYESEGTRPAAASAVEERAWEERYQWEEPATGRGASGEQASSNAEQGQEWASDGAAAAGEWNDNSAAHGADTKDTYSNEQPSLEWKEDSPRWPDAGESSAKQPSEEWREDAAAWNTVVDGK